MKGFLLTRQWRDTPEGVQLDCWLASDQGPIRLLIPPQASVCFIRADDLPYLKPCLKRFPSITYKTVSLKNFHGEPVLAVYCLQQRQLRELCQLLEAEGVTVWEQDIKPPDRFFMERFITAGLCIEGLSVVNNELENASLYQANQSFTTVTTKRVSASDYQPCLSVVSLDIETSMDAKTLYSIAVYGEDYSRVFMVDEYAQKNPQNAQENNGSQPEIIWCESAKVCLQVFIQWLNKTDPDVIIGWHVVQFDFWVLQQLCKRWQVKFAIGRGNQLVHWREDGQHPERRYLQIPGRIVLDGIELLRTAFYNFESFSLQNVANELLGDSKLLNHDDRGQAITDLFQDNKIALAEYNIQDCKLVWDIFEHTRLLDFAIERSRLTGMAMDRMGGSVASFEYAYLPPLHRAGYVAPNLGELESDVVSPGGYVMRSKPGLYRHVLVLDFKSLYPSIIRTFTIDPYAFWFAEHNHLNDDEVVPGFNGARFARNESILPEIIVDLWNARDRAKADNNKPLSQAIKIIMNSFYGVLGSTGCRFLDPRVCSSITLRGHDIIQRSRDWIEQQGYEVIYGDTDSLFVWLGNNECDQQQNQAEDEQANAVGQQLARGLNLWWQKKLQEEFSIDSALEIEFETHYSHFLMPTIRGSKEGSKKRYAGIVNKLVNGETQQELTFKGLETVRTDWTPIAKEFQKVLYQKVFMQEPYREYISKMALSLLAGELDEQLVYKKRLRRALNLYEKTSPPHVKAARKLAAGGEKPLGRGDRIEYVITVNGPEPLDDLHSQIDYQHYIDKQLKPIADSILTFLNDDFDSITEAQMSLL